MSQAGTIQSLIISAAFLVWMQNPRALLAEETLSSVAGYLDACALKDHRVESQEVTFQSSTLFIYRQAKQGESLFMVELNTDNAARANIAIDFAGIKSKSYKGYFEFECATPGCITVHYTVREWKPVPEPLGEEVESTMRVKKLNNLRWGSDCDFNTVRQADEHLSGYLLSRGFIWDLGRLVSRN